MTDIKFMVDAVKLLNQTWNECSKNCEHEAPTEVYNAMCEVEEAITNLIEKTGEASRVISICKMFNKGYPNIRVKQE